MPHMVTGSIAHSTKHQYLSYSEADFEVFCPAEATCCTDGGEIWQGGVERSLRAKFYPQRCNDNSIGPPKLKILVKFYGILEYKRPQGCIPCTIFTKFAQSVQRLRMR